MGEDRRRTDPKLDAAMAEVRHLYGSVEELASAVARSVPRDEIEAREREHKQRERQFRDQAKLFLIGLGVLFLLLVTYSVLTVRNLNSRIDTGHQILHTDHEILICVAKLSEGTRTDAAVLACRQAVKGG
jgi:type II secretory pathway component PulM